MTASSTMSAPISRRPSARHRFGVVAIVAAQEFQWVFRPTRRPVGRGGLVRLVKTERRVGRLYFYIHDREFGPGFIKICTYFPYPAKVWLNGHEWAKRQARRGRVDFSELANGFAACAKPERLQAICDAFGPERRPGVLRPLDHRDPDPFTAGDRAAGYWWELSMRQVEVSRTLVFDDPRRARGFFEALVADNVGIGRPEEVGRRLRPPGAQDHQGALLAPGSSAPGTEVKMDFRYKHSRVKQYLKEGRAYRIETVINKPVGPGSSGPDLSICPSSRQGPPGQPSAAYDRACRPGLCHRLCAL